MGIKKGTRAANAALALELLDNLRADDESIAASVQSGVTMQRQALANRQQEQLRAKKLSTHSKRIAAESEAILEKAEADYERAMRVAEDVLTQTGVDSAESAEEIEHLAEGARSITIPIKSRKGNMQMVGQQ